MIAIGVDIGGTKIRSGVIDARGRMLADTRHPTEAAKGAAHVLQVIEMSVRELLAEIGTEEVAGLGISSAGVIEPTSGRVVGSADQIPGWAGQCLGDHFSRRFGWSVVADNDANCALLGEVWRGGHALSKGPDAVMITLGTGLGGAVMSAGRLVTGRHHLTGHFGIARMWDRYSNTEVRVEHLVSGTGLGNIYAQVAGGNPLAGSEVISRLQRGDALAETALERWCEHLALQLHNLYWMIDPELIIIGGGVIDARLLWWERMLAAVARYGVSIPLSPAALGNDAGVYGAAKRVFDAARPGDQL